MTMTFPTALKLVSDIIRHAQAKLAATRDDVQRAKLETHLSRFASTRRMLEAGDKTMLSALSAVVPVRAESERPDPAAILEGRADALEAAEKISISTLILWAQSPDMTGKAARLAATRRIAGMPYADIRAQYMDILNGKSTAPSHAPKATTPTAKPTPKPAAADDLADLSPTQRAEVTWKRTPGLQKQWPVCSGYVAYSTGRIGRPVGGIVRTINQPAK